MRQGSIGGGRLFAPGPSEADGSQSLISIGGPGDVRRGGGPPPSKRWGTKSDEWRGAAVAARTRRPHDMRQVLVESDPSMLIAATYLRHMRQHLSRNARDQRTRLDWDTEEGFESAFQVFGSVEIGVAARALFYAICPVDPEVIFWDPPHPNLGELNEEFYNYATYTVLFLTVQQFVENMRQATASPVPLSAACATSLARARLPRSLPLCHEGPGMVQDA